MSGGLEKRALAPDLLIAGWAKTGTELLWDLLEEVGGCSNALRVERHLVGPHRWAVGDLRKFTPMARRAVAAYQRADQHEKRQILG